LIVHLDTSALIAALADPRPAAVQLRELAERGDTPVISTPVLFEWCRGPRTASELRLQRELIPDDQIAPFDVPCARRAATLYAQLTRRRHRDVDIAIAACAIEHHASLWTLNIEDFSDIPGLRLYRPT